MMKTRPPGARQFCFRREDEMNCTNRAAQPILAILCLALCLPFFGRGQDNDERTLRLPLGDPKLKDKTMAVSAGEILSARTGKPVAFPRMIQGMGSSRFVYVGESHDNLMMHDIQLRIIQALYEKSPRIAIGLEMLPTETQPVLDRWSQGLLTRDEFLRESLWYVHWSLNFGFYEKIFDFAKANKIPLYSLNVPREVITKVRMGGWDSLSDAEKAMVPRLDLTLEEHRTLMRAIFGEAEIPHEMKGGQGFDKMFEGLYRAQVAWDEVMAANAIRGAEASNARMVVLAGSGHMLYKLGINRRVYDQNHLPSTTVTAVSLEPAEKDIVVARSLADYVFGIPEEARPAYPTIGLALKKVEGLDNLVIERRPFDGVAAGRGFEKGDIILSVDGRAFSSVNELRMYLAGFTWDDECRFRLLRGGEIKEIVLDFREAPASEPEKK
jgi:uncharacterized iron-regulated protein